MLISDKATIHESAVVGKDTRIEPGAVIYENCKIGNDCIIGANAVLRPGTHIGNKTIFGPLSISQGDVNIGNNTTISPQSHITMGMSIGSSVFIAPCVVTVNTPEITSAEHGTSKNKSVAVTIPPKIEDYVRIGTGVTVMPGIVIGHHSLIAARCILTKDVPPHSFVIGGKDQIGRIS
ncbi:MAG: DapH/DapD/GlmU-related protein [Thaumarchaeota archaeon]|nr:DapH/DapD/GlmU-related protein [Nitrososphaerota archaeon]